MPLKVVFLFSTALELIEGRRDWLYVELEVRWWGKNQLRFVMSIVLVIEAVGLDFELFEASVYFHAIYW